MAYVDGRVSIDADSDCGSAGDICDADGRYLISPQPEPVPEWFAQALDEHFAGAGVPREYAFCVRVRSLLDQPQKIELRFHFTATNGRNYMAPPYWLCRGGRWRTIAADDTDYVTEKYADICCFLTPGETVWLANKPYVRPADIEEEIDELVDRFPFFYRRELGRTAEGRPIIALETDAREDAIAVGATMQPAEPGARPVLAVAHSLTDRSALSEKMLQRFQFCFIPMPNPDGAATGRSLTNAQGEVPMFSFERLLAGREAPAETEAVWRYMEALVPAAYMEFHPHYQDVQKHKLNPMALDWYPAAMHERVKRVEDTLIGLNDAWRVTHLEPSLPLGDCGKFNNLARAFHTLAFCYQIYAITEEATQAHAIRAVLALAEGLAGPEWVATRDRVDIVKG